jgi:hypothetical protein
MLQIAPDQHTAAQARVSLLTFAEMPMWQQVLFPMDAPPRAALLTNNAAPMSIQARVQALLTSNSVPTSVQETVCSHQLPSDEDDTDRVLGS